MKYKEDRPFAEPEAAARQLLAIILARNIDAGQYADVGATNTAFPEAGGSVAEYLAGEEFGIAQGWFEFDRSGTRIILLAARRGTVN